MCLYAWVVCMTVGWPWGCGERKRQPRIFPGYPISGPRDLNGDRYFSRSPPRILGKVKFSDLTNNLEAPKCFDEKRQPSEPLGSAKRFVGAGGGFPTCCPISPWMSEAGRYGRRGRELRKMSLSCPLTTTAWRLKVPPALHLSGLSLLPTFLSRGPWCLGEQEG